MTARYSWEVGIDPSKLSRHGLQAEVPGVHSRPLTGTGRESRTSLESIGALIVRVCGGTLSWH
jgi:hypothetical protein